MKNEYEIISHKKIKHINIMVNKIYYRTFHMHNDFELIMVLDGSGIVRTAKTEHRMEKGSIVILNSFEMHEFDARGNGMTALIYQISNHFMREYAPYIRYTVFRDGDVAKYLSDKEREDFIDIAIKGARSFYRGDNLFELDTVGYITRMVKMMLSRCAIEILSEKDYLQKKKSAQRIDRIYSYIDQNYTTPIRLSDVAELENISPTHFSHIFTENFGENFQEYVKNLRFEHAVRIISENTLSLREVAEQSGFSDPKYMTKMFEKKLGVNPKNFRRQLVSAGNDSKSTDILEHIYNEKEAIALFDKYQK